MTESNGVELFCIINMRDLPYSFESEIQTVFSLVL